MTDTNKVLCKHCNVSYTATKDNFYTSKGRLILNKCKECKRADSRRNEKNRKPRDRVEFYRLYYLRRKEKKSIEKKGIV